MKDVIKQLLRENMGKNSLGVDITRPNQELIFMRGIPGSGKSTQAKKVGQGGAIHSTDDLIDANGDYREFFNKMIQSKNFGPLSKMHGLNLKNAIKSIQDGVSPVVIDNTNIKPAEMKNYAVEALEWGLSDENIKFVNVGTGGASAEELAKRNLHGVPLEKIEQMIQSYNSAGDMTLQKVLGAKDMYGSSDILYSAVVLDKVSHDLLLREFNLSIPDDWKLYAHHMTIQFGKSAPEQDLGKEVGLVVNGLGISDMAVAVSVEGYQSSNERPHITLAINPEGGKPVMSNQITNWKKCQTIKIRGVVTNIKK